MIYYSSYIHRTVLNTSVKFEFNAPVSYRIPVRLSIISFIFMFNTLIEEFLCYVVI